MVVYLEKEIVATRHTERPRYGMTTLGYTVRRGAPTSLMIKLEGEKIWRRVMLWQFSNASTTFVRIHGKALVIPTGSLP